MELPKNITQIGEVDKTCKVYVEDYVVSYIKELNAQAENKEISIALYGRHELENGIDYHFIYGACRVEQLFREVRHLSQAQQQEIERFRRKYFPELSFAGYRLLNGEMIEGFYICDRDICRYISGYAQFYEKNDAMLAYMLDVRETVKPECVDQEKYERVKQRQEERRSAAEAAEGSTGHSVLENGKKILSLPSSQNLQRMRLASVAVFALLCLFGIATFRKETADTPEQENLVAVNAPAANVVSPQEPEEKDRLVIEDKLDEVLRQENSQENAIGASESVAQETLEVTEMSASAETSETAESSASETAETPEMAETSETTESSETPEVAELSETAGASESQASLSSDEVQAAAEPLEAVAYIIQPGDTLIAISRRQYGTDSRVQDICERNKITDPDNIKQGQVIMLPR